jgi:hypothetical protein
MAHQITRLAITADFVPNPRAANANPAAPKNATNWTIRISAVRKATSSPASRCAGVKSSCARKTDDIAMTVWIPSL